MSLRVKLISTISAFILTLSCLLVGVFAAQNVSLNVGGNVSFTASSVYADITGSYVGTAEHPSSAQSLTPISIDAETTDGAVDMTGHEDWTSMPLNFDESASPITVTIKIQNKAQDRSISVSITDNTGIANVSVERKYNNSTYTSTSATKTIVGGQTGTFTFTLRVTNQNSNISGIFDLDVELENAGESASTGDYVVTINNTSDRSFFAKTNLDDSNYYTIESGTSEEIQVNSMLYLTTENSYFPVIASNSVNDDISTLAFMWNYSVNVNSITIGRFSLLRTGDGYDLNVTAVENNEIKTNLERSYYVLTCEITKNVVINLENE